MTEGFSFNDDVVFAFEQLALSAQEKATLTKEEQAALKKMPRIKRTQQKEELLKKAESEKKSQLLLKIRELEEKIQESDLPSEIKTKMLEMTQYAKTHDMNFFFDVKHQIDKMKAEVAVAKAQENKSEKQQAEKMTVAAVGIVVGGAALAPFIQVRYTPEEYEKRTTAYFENKIVEELVSGKTEMTPPQMAYPKKQGSVYSQRHYQVADKHKAEVQNLIVAQIQEKQKKAGITVQTAEKIMDTLNHMHPVKQRAAERAVLTANPEVKKKQEAEKKQVSAEEILRGLVRRQRDEERNIIRALQKERTALQKENTKTAAHHIALLDKKIQARQETAAALSLFVEHDQKMMQANETTADTLIKAATKDGKTLTSAIVDQITSLDMAGFKARVHTQTKGLANRLAQHSTPIKAMATPKATMRLAKTEQKGISKHLIEVAKKTPTQQNWDKETVKKAVRNAAQKAGQQTIPTTPKVTEAWKKIAQKMGKEPIKTTAKGKNTLNNQTLRNAFANTYRQAG